LVDLDTPHEPSARPELRALHCADQSPRLGRPGVDGPAAPTCPGAVGHPIDWDGFRRDLNSLRSVLTDALCWLDEIDPTPGGLAAVADVTDLDGKRK